VVWVKRRDCPHSASTSADSWEAWTGRKPDVSMLRVWGCMGCVHVTPPEQQAEGKLGTRGVMCIHLGIDEESKAWRMYDPEAAARAHHAARGLHGACALAAVAGWENGGKMQVESQETILQLLPVPQPPATGGEELQSAGGTCCARRRRTCGARRAWHEGQRRLESSSSPGSTTAGTGGTSPSTTALSIPSTRLW